MSAHNTFKYYDAEEQRGMCLMVFENHVVKHLKEEITVG